MIEVTRVRHAGGYKLSLWFSDGSRGTADLSGELAKRKRWAPLRDEKVFAKAKVDGGTVAWPGDFDLAPERLYALAHRLPPPKTEADDRANIATVTLRQIRELTGRTQAELAEHMGKSQAELSRVESRKREDIRLSTLREYVEALGGKVELVVTIGKRRVVLSA